MVMYKEGNNILSTGYKINSYYLDNNIPVSKSLNNNDNKNLEKNNKVSDLFSNLAIPSGLFSIEKNKIIDNNFKINTSDKVIDSTIFDKLLSSESLKKSKYFKTTRRLGRKNNDKNEKNSKNDKKNKKKTRKNI